MVHKKEDIKKVQKEEKTFYLFNYIFLDNLIKRKFCKYKNPDPFKNFQDYEFCPCSASISIR